MMEVVFGEFAKLEFDDAYDWYDSELPGLGARFAKHVGDAIERIGRMPMLYPVEQGEVRKCVLSRFPYTLRYVVRQHDAVIVAVSHHHRHPEYWVGQS